MTKALKWVSSEGGPLVCVPASFSHLYLGALGRGGDGNLHEELPGDFMNPAITHYGAVCALDDGILITAGTVDNIPLIVLGDVPSLTTWQSLSTEASLFIRWDAADSDETISVIHEHMNSIQWQSEFELDITEEDWYLFDSAARFKDLREQDSIRLKFNKGHYAVSSGYFCINDRDSFLVHRFEMLPG